MVGVVAGALVLGAGVALYGTYKAGEAADDAAEAQRQGEAVKSRMASADAAKSRLQQVREARIRNAQVTAAGSNAGMGVSSSGIAGAVGSVTTQAAGNIGTINQKQSFAAELSYYNQQSADASTKAANAQQWAQVGMQVAGMAAGKIK